jgi:hypothetical protein
MRKLGVWCALLLLLGSAAGCVQMFADPLGREFSFNDSQRQYTNYLRWGEIEKASTFVDPALRQDFLSQAPVFEGLRITDYEIGAIDYTGDIANVTVTYAGYTLANAVEHRIREKQTWYREDNSNTWRVRSDIAVFGEAFGTKKQ